MLFPSLIDGAIQEVIKGRVGYYWEVLDGPHKTFPVLEVFFKSSDGIEDVKRHNFVARRLFTELGFTHKQISVDSEDLRDIADGYGRVMIVFDPGTIDNSELETLIDVLSLYGSAKV
jgi:hypothetical protein